MRDIDEAIDKYKSYGSDAQQSGPTEPISKRMKDSYVEGYLPFTTDPVVREDYINAFGGIRLGKLLEDLDALSGAIAYKHCDDLNHRTLPLAIVTASVDRIDLLNSLEIDRDMRLSGHVTYVGSSSMEITVRVESSIKEGEVRDDEDGGMIPIMLARFTFVARDPTTDKAARVNTLALTTHLEHEIFEAGRRAKEQASIARRTDLSRQAPTAAESAAIHQTWSSNYGLDDLDIRPKPGSISPRQTQLGRALLCHPAQRNLRNNVFGGYLMKESYDLAFITANIHLAHRPRFLSSSQLTFSHPVPIGSVLDFKARVVAQNETRFCVTVTADTVVPATQDRRTTSTFHYTFSRTCDENGAGQICGRELISETYGDAVRQVAAQRRERGALSREDQIQLFRRLRLPAST
ncbi:putative Acyl-CoA thioester hydrolase [Taphrina deformans PYCC 5710]|uniref:Acyl-CoA thioester hydrolase n=1 Tax=Taphrina deformans (strain PYCC 5710 / ATCC 11124 / CBS 356.35 / IMI 108563 / JCM 9778 / NBRC 8474) TaxID=1097556 RepID=R4XGB4_TAPDE|nr:putative Acyl-CoA thioester hydrolase [Taphrina deformans PYCC 5710]|eukprot:CCG82424.1 putative Acyl-CoA thioester hydrolase [Taphrina deformans PYCC 5710]